VVLLGDTESGLFDTRRREHSVLLIKRVAIESRPRSTAANSSWVIVWMGDVDTTMILSLMSTAGKATPFSRGEGEIFWTHPYENIVSFPML
jgi:hypothetical protein